MYRGLFLLLACLAVTVYGNAIKPKVPMPDGRVVGGEDTTVEQFPYQVSVRMLGSHICGGSIVNSRVVITAAHCIYPLGASYYSISYGTTKVGGGRTITAERLLKHQQYDSDVIDYDIALIFLRDDIIFSSVAQPIALATEAPKAGTTAVISGWGTTTENGSSPTTLQMVHVQIVDQNQCKKEYSAVNEITERMLCAGVEKGGKDACQGDSGGPLAADGILVGIVSWGVGCARPDYSGVYTNVSHFLDWINSNIA